MKDKNWIDAITFKNDMMFKSVMQNPEICKEVLELVLGFKLRKIGYPDLEKQLENGIVSHAVRLDVYVEDEQGRMINIEMQNADKGNLPMRARYYQSMMDISAIRKGKKDYRDLPDCYVIFLCDFNPFGGRRRVYHVQPRAIDELDMDYDDGSEKIFLCTKGDEADTPIEILQFLSYLKDSKPTNPLTRRIDEEVGRWKENDGWRKIYMENHAHEMDLRREGRAEANALHAAEEARFGKLLKLLRAAGRNEEALDAFEDKELRKRLYAEYGIE